MSDSQTIHLLVIAIFILCFLLTALIITALHFSKKNNDLVEIADTVFANEQQLKNDLEEVINALYQTNHLLIAYNDNGRFNISIEQNRRMIKRISLSNELTITIKK